MKRYVFRSKRILLFIATAAVAAVVFTVAGTDIVFPPAYSKPVQDKSIDDGAGHTAVQTGTRLTVFKEEEAIWELPSGIRAQDFFIEDIDRDGRRDLLVLCWKRGRYGRQRPTWVKHDEIKWSQHIYVYDITGDKVTPKWMASDIGVHAASMQCEKDRLYITDTKGSVTEWRWVSWGFEKL